MSKHKKPSFWSQYQPTGFAMSLVILMIFTSAYTLGLKLSGGMQGSFLVAQLVDCGNGQLDDGEECDDGNTMNYDACSSRCLEENKEPLYLEDVAMPLMKMKTEFNSQPFVPTPAPAPKALVPKKSTPKPVVQTSPQPAAALVVPESVTPNLLRGAAVPQSVILQETVKMDSQLQPQYLPQKMHGVPQSEKTKGGMEWRDEDLLFMFLVLTFFGLTLVAHLLLYSMNTTQNALLKQKMDHMTRSRSKLRVVPKKRS